MAAAVVFLSLIIIGSSPNLGVSRWLKAAEEKAPQETKPNLFDSLLEKAKKIKSQAEIIALGKVLEESNKKIKIIYNKLELPSQEKENLFSNLILQEVLPRVKRIKANMAFLIMEGDDIIKSLKEEKCPSNEIISKRILGLIAAAREIKTIVSELKSEESLVALGLKEYFFTLAQEDAEKEMLELTNKILEAGVSGTLKRGLIEGRLIKINIWAVRLPFINKPGFTKIYKKEAITKLGEEKLEQTLDTSPLDLYIEILEKFVIETF